MTCREASVTRCSPYAVAELNVRAIAQWGWCQLTGVDIGVDTLNRLTWCQHLQLKYDKRLSNFAFKLCFQTLLSTCDESACCQHLTLF